MGVVILLLGGIAVMLVHIRRAEMTARHEIQTYQIRQVKLRRKLSDQQVRLGYLTSPGEVDKRAEQMKLDLVHAKKSGSRPTDNQARRPGGR